MCWNSIWHRNLPIISLYLNPCDAICDIRFTALLYCRKKYEAPILAAREPWAMDEQKSLAEKALTELSNIVNQFILRRTNSLLSKHLPPKLVQVVCVKMTPLQTKLYAHFLESKALSLVMSGKNSGVLSSITALRKLVNHPKLIYDAMKQSQAQGGGRKDEGAAGFEDCEQVMQIALRQSPSSDFSNLSLSLSSPPSFFLTTFNVNAPPVRR